MALMIVEGVVEEVGPATPLVSETGQTDESGAGAPWAGVSWTFDRQITSQANASQAASRRASAGLVERASAHTEDRMRALRAGFRVHVSKPVEPGELVATVASVVGPNRRGLGEG